MVDQAISRYLAEDRATPIIVGIDEDSSMAALPRWKPLDCVDAANDVRVAYGLHQYEPFEYTHESEEFDPKFMKLHAMFRNIVNWRADNLGRKEPFAVNEFGVKWKRPSAIQFIEKEYDALTQGGFNHAIWLWDDPLGACYAPDMSVTEFSEFFDAVKKKWAER